MERKAVLMATIAVALLLVSAGVALAETINCTGGPCTGSNDKDKMYGTAGIDVMEGFGGNDTMYGLGDTDSMFGSSGNDKVYGGDGNDFVYGYYSGGDLLVGGSGHDELDAKTYEDSTSGPDTIRGGDGEDTIQADNNKRDYINCGADVDVAVVDGIDRVSKCELIV